MSRLDTSWIDYPNKRRGILFNSNIEELRKNINEALQDFNNGNCAAVRLWYDWEGTDSYYHDDIVKQCCKELRKAGFWTNVDHDWLFIYRGFFMSLFGK